MSSSALHDAMAARVERGEFPGIVTLVAHGDDVSVDTIGVTRFGGQVPMRRDTPFRVASLTKPLLAAATMALVEDDVVDLEEPVTRLLPELSGQRVLARIDGPLDETVAPVRPVTVADLLTFRLGFGVITEPQFDPPYPIVTAWREAGLVLSEPDPRTTHDPDEWIRRFGALPLMHQPGQWWRYNTGTLVLGVLVARAAGQPLGEVLRERLFEPLGMPGTGFWVPAARARELPHHYMTDPGTGEMTDRTGRTPPEQWSRPPVFPSGSGGLISTVDDLHTFGAMMLAGGVHGGTRVLSGHSVRLMTTNHLTAAQIAAGGQILAGSGWGLGMAVTTEPDEISAAGRYGWAGGYGTSWFNDPAQHLTGIALTQVSDFLWSGARTAFDRLAAAR